MLYTSDHWTRIFLKLAPRESEKHRYIPEEALHRYGTPRPAFLALVGLVTAAASAMAAFAGLGALFPASIMAGLAFGAPGTGLMAR